MARSPVRNRGITTVELVTTLAIASIFSVMAVPSFMSTIQNNRNATQINEFRASLSFARTEAIFRNTSVSMCVSGNGTTCHDHSDHWHHGWIVFVDSDSDGAIDGEEILRVYSKLVQQSKFEFSDETVITYASTGLVIAGSNGTFTLCDNRGAAHAKGLIIGTSSRVRLAIDSDENGILEDVSDTDLVCSS